MSRSILLGGLLSNSTAVITDAAHMCIDATGFLISLTAMYLATKQPTARLSFGYVRAGTIIEMFSSTQYYLMHLSIVI
jgi:Co/Zn/Cd efflux system component